MAYKHIFTQDAERIIRAIVVDNAGLGEVGSAIDRVVATLMGYNGDKFYKIENDGVLYGYYSIAIMDGSPRLADYGMRKIFKGTTIETEIENQINIWVQAES
jgi:hypothetical protein